MAKTKIDARGFLEGLFAPKPDGPRSGNFRAPASPDELPPDWRELFEERAAIREFDGGQAREHAEAEALREISERMRRVRAGV